MKIVRSLLVLTALVSSASFAMLPNPTQTNTIAPVLAEQTAPAQAVQGEQVEGVVMAFLVGQSGDQEVLTPINHGMTIKAGDVVEYRGYFTNKGTDRVRKMTVSLGIPQGVELIGGIEPVASASIDGNRFGSMPLRANIGGQIQAVPLSMYKALRWNVEDIGINGTAVVSYRVVVK